MAKRNNTMRADARALNWTGTRCQPGKSSATATRSVAVVTSIFIMAPWTISDAFATEGGLGRPVAGMSVFSGVGIVAPEPITAVSIEQIYINGSIGGSREVPIAGKTSLGIDAPVAFTLASLLRVWDGAGGWDFASGITVPYVWTEVTAELAVGGAGASTSDRASNLFDLYFTPIIAGYHFSNTSHIAAHVNFWALPGHYDPNALASPSLNNWTFVPQVAYTQLVPKYDFEFNIVAGLQALHDQHCDRLPQCTSIHARYHGAEKVRERSRCRHRRRNRATARQRLRPRRRASARFSRTRLRTGARHYLRHEDQRQASIVGEPALGSDSDQYQPHQEHGERHGDSDACVLM